jgi:hypothetical protein
MYRVRATNSSDEFSPCIYICTTVIYTAGPGAVEHYRNLKISRRPIALGIDSIAVGIVYAEGCPRRRCPST